MGANKWAHSVLYIAPPFSYTFCANHFSLVYSSCRLALSSSHLDSTSATTPLVVLQVMWEICVLYRKNMQSWARETISINKRDFRGLLGADSADELVSCPFHHFSMCRNPYLLVGPCRLVVILSTRVISFLTAVHHCRTLLSVQCIPR